MSLERALLLIEQSRPELAERELRRQLATDPDEPLAHALLALCLARDEAPGGAGAPGGPKGGRLVEATDEAREAIRLAPDLPFAHYVLASVLHDRARPDEATAAVREAIRLDPQGADAHALLAQLHLDGRRWNEALASAGDALAIDPEHVAANNLRAMALVKLRRPDEAGATIAATLARDPENALTHANQGWALLHRGGFAPALEEFREALRLDPTQEWARAGLVEALKARYPVYGLLLRYFLWMSTLSRRAQWAVVLGGLFGFRALRAVAAANPTLAPWLTPLFVLYGLFVFLTWTAEPLFNLLLRLNRFGRYALSAEEITASSWAGACLLGALAAVGLGAATGESFFFGLALVGAILVLLVSGVFRCAPGWPRRTMAGYTALVAGIGLLSVPLTLAVPQDPASGIVPVVVALFMGGAGTWLATLLGSVRPKR